MTEQRASPTSRDQGRITDERFLVAVSSLFVCGILLCFLAYAADNFPFVPRVYDMPKPTQHISVAPMPQQAETQKTTVEEDSRCSPCVERMASILEVMGSEWETDMTAFFEQSQKTPVQGWVWLSSEQRERTKELFDQYGTAEGLRHLWELDPEAARRFGRGPLPQSPRRQGEDGEHDGYSDDGPPDDTP